MTGTGRGRISIGMLASVLLAGCATTTSTASAPEPVEIQRYTVTATVLESPEHGPQLCLGGVLESYPPQCGGPDVVGLDWADVDSEESANGTTWGEYGLTGTWDGDALTLTEPPAPPERVEPDHSVDIFASPCEPPAGGWTVVDAATATERDMQAAISYARARAEHAGVWLDSLSDVAEERPFDPTDVVLNARFTGDLESHEAQLRRLWGGPLCVTFADRPLDELNAVARRLHDDLDAISSGADEITGVVTVTVPVADEQLRAEIRAEYGDFVEVEARLRPVD